MGGEGITVEDKDKHWGWEEMGYRCLSLAGVGDEEGESNCVGIVGCGQSLDVVFLNAVLKQFI